MKTYTILFFCLCIFSCFQGPKSIEIRDFNCLNYNDSFEFGNKLHLREVKFYLVDNYVDNDYSDSVIAAFVYHQKFDSSISQVHFTFYKKSAITNETNIKQNPRDIDRYSQDHDLIFSYSWSKNEDRNINPYIMSKFRNGKMLTKGKVSIEPL